MEKSKEPMVSDARSKMTAVTGSSKLLRFNENPTKPPWEFHPENTELKALRSVILRTETGFNVETIFFNNCLKYHIKEPMNLLYCKITGG